MRRRWIKVAGWLLIVAVTCQLLLLYAEAQGNAPSISPAYVGGALGGAFVIFAVAMVFAFLSAFGPKARWNPVLSPVMSGTIAGLAITGLVWIGSQVSASQNGATDVDMAEQTFARAPPDFSMYGVPADEECVTPPRNGQLLVGDC